MVENGSYSGTGSFAAGLSYSEMAEEYARRQSWRSRLANWLESLRASNPMSKREYIDMLWRSTSATAELDRVKKFNVGDID